MATKKDMNAKEELPKEPLPAPKEELKAEPVVAAPVVNRDKSVKVINNGPRFVVNLVAYGYGGAWPTKAVYVIPSGVFMDCLAKGHDLVMV